MKQYVLAAYLLGGASRLRILLPLAHISQEPHLAAAVHALWPRPPFQNAFAYYKQLTGGYLGTSFWLETV